MLLTEFGTIPRRALIYLAIANLAGMASDLFLWSHRPALLPTDYVLVAVVMTGWIGVSYAVLMAMVDEPASFPGFAKFLAATAVVAIPFMLALAGLILSARGGLVANVALLALVGLILILPLLSGWPILQSLSNRVISPLTALRATRGSRFELIGISFVIGGLSRVLPAAFSTEHLVVAVLLASGNALVGMLSAMIGFSAAVAGYRYICHALQTEII